MDYSRNLLAAVVQERCGLVVCAALLNRFPFAECPVLTLRLSEYHRFQVCVLVASGAAALFERAAGENPYSVQRDLQEAMQDLVGFVRITLSSRTALRCAARWPTIAPADKKLLHGMRDAMLAPTAIS